MEAILTNPRNYSKRLNGKLNSAGKIIKSYRIKNHISRQTLSDKLMIMGIDISAQSIYDLETGNRAILDYELCAIAKCLGVSSNDLLKDFEKYLDQNLYE